MTHEKLRQYSQNQIDGIRIQAKCRGVEPSGILLELHTAVLELLDENDHLREMVKHAMTDQVSEEEAEAAIMRIWDNCDKNVPIDRMKRDVQIVRAYIRESEHMAAGRT